MKRRFPNLMQGCGYGPEGQELKPPAREGRGKSPRYDQFRKGVVSVAGTASTHNAQLWKQNWEPGTPFKHYHPRSSKKSVKLSKGFRKRERSGRSMAQRVKKHFREKRKRETKDMKNTGKTQVKQRKSNKAKRGKARKRQPLIYVYIYIYIYAPLCQ